VEVAGRFVECKDIHGGGCVDREIRYFLDLAPHVLLMCVVPYFLPGLFLKNRKLLEWNIFKEWILKASSKTICSSLFVLGYGIIFGSTMCLTRNIRKCDDHTNTIISGLFSGTAIAFESFHRRLDLLMYTLAKVLQIIHRMLLKRNWIYSIPNGEVILFCISMAIYMNQFQKNPNLIKPFYVRTAISLFV